MSAELIHEAAKNLSIQAVYLRESKFTQIEDFDPTLLSEFDLSAQYRSGAFAKHLATIQDADGSEQLLMNVRFSCELRLIDVTRMVDEKPETGIVAEIGAVFVAQYLIKEGSNPRTEALDAFSKMNAGYHVWPYWREYAQSVCTRAGLPIVMIPMFTLPKENQLEQPKEMPPKEQKKTPDAKTSSKRSAKSKTPQK